MHSPGACLASQSKTDDSSDGPAFKVCLALPEQYFLCNLLTATSIAQCQQQTLTAFKIDQCLVI